MSTEKIRLCIITPAHWKAIMGGAQYQAKCILDELLPTQRYEVTYLANRVDRDFEPANYRIVRIGGRVPRLGYLSHTLPLYRALRKFGPDVIYQRVGCGYTGIAAYYAKHNGARLIWHVAHDTDVQPEDHLGNPNPVQRFLEKRSIEYAIRHARHIVTQTEYQASLLEKNYGRVADAVIPNFHPAPTEPIDKAGPLTVVWVANLKRWKQPDVFVRLAAALSDLTDVRFVMAGLLMPGRGDRAWATKLTQQIRDTPNLHYLGQQSQNAVNELLGRAHVFVNTSLHEGFANTFIQAWMREVPVVSLYVNPDAIFDRERVGLLAGSEERLQWAVRELLTNTQFRREYASRARAHAAARHSVRNARLLAEFIDTGANTSKTTRRGLDAATLRRFD